MDLLLAMWIAYYLVKNTTQDLVYKSTGKMPPSYLREQERRRRRAERGPVTDRQEGRKFLANAWHDAWEEAAERREHGRDQRRQERRERWAREGSAGGPGDVEPDAIPAPVAETAEPEAKVAKTGEPDVAGMDVADPVAPGRRAAPAGADGEPGYRIADDAPDLSQFDVPGPRPGAVDNEEVMYRRYALRRTNGAAMSPDQLAAEVAPLGLTADDAEVLHDDFDARYAKEHGVDRTPPPDLAKAASRMTCNDCGGKTQLEPNPDERGKWTMRATHTDEDCTQNTARSSAEAVLDPSDEWPPELREEWQLDDPEQAERFLRVLREGAARREFAEEYNRADACRQAGDPDGADRHLAKAEEAAAKLGITTKEEMQEVLDSENKKTAAADAAMWIPASPSTPAPSAPASESPQMKENDMSASGETTGLASALAYTSAMSTSAAEAANSVETSLASLTAGEVSGPGLAHLATAQEHFNAAQAAMDAAHAEFTSHQNVQEAYTANQGAGNKQFLLND